MLTSIPVRRGTRRREGRGAALGAAFGAALATLGLLVAGCSIAVDPGDEGGGGSAPGDGSGGSSSSIAASDDGATDDDDVTADDGDGTALSDLPEDLADHAFNQVTCGGGELELSTPGTVVRVVDTCERLVVSGAGSVVVAEEVGELVVEIIAVVHVASASSIEVTSGASGAQVTWGSGSPTVTNDAAVAVVQPAEPS